MFKLFGHGFQLDLDNGYTISVMVSPIHMCSNKRHEKEYMEMMKEELDTCSSFGLIWDCPNAEIAVMDTITNKFIPIDGEDAKGYQSINDFMRIMNEVKEYPNTDSKMDEMKKLGNDSTQSIS